MEPSENQPGQRPMEMKKEVTRTVQMRYLLFLPKGYGGDEQKRWPLMLFLHGAGERGTNLELVKKHGPPKIVEQQPDFPFIVVSPQCPTGRWWDNDLEDLSALLDEVQTKYRVDLDRVYLTGLSMGGFGSWSLATREPDRFAAIVPICGGGQPLLAGRLKNVPVWAFHGAKDPVVPVDATKEMVRALEKSGGNVKMTVYPEAGHDSWTEAYNNPELYKWLLEQKRKPREGANGR
jgi:predicted peptidase